MPMCRRDGLIQEYTREVIRCAITDLKIHSEEPARSRNLLLDRARGWIVDGIELIQLREKHLDARDLLLLAENLVRLAAGSNTKILVNSRADVALAAGAHGVHLTAHPQALRPEQVRAVFSAVGRRRAAVGQKRPLVSISCHTVAEVEQAVGVDLILFGPVFEKRVGSMWVQPGAGLGALGEAVRRAGDVPVLALGGIRPDQFADVLASGAAGVAGIRLFA